MNGTRVDLCGIVGNTGDPDDDGIRWTFDVVDDFAVQSVEVGSATGRSGGTLLTDDLGERRPVVNGLAKCPNASAADRALQIVRGSLPARLATGELITYEEVPKRQLVRRAAPPRVPLHNARLVRFQLDLLALDSFRRALEPTTVPTIAAGATVNVTNGGNAPAYFTIVAAGSGVVKLRQDASGQVLRSRVSVASGTRFDCGRRRVTTSGGVVLTGVLDNPSEWLCVPPESTVPVTNQGAVPLNLEIFDTFD